MILLLKKGWWHYSQTQESSAFINGSNYKHGKWRGCSSFWRHHILCYNNRIFSKAQNGISFFCSWWVIGIPRWDGGIPRRRRKKGAWIISNLRIQYAYQISIPSDITNFASQLINYFIGHNNNHMTGKSINLYLIRDNMIQTLYTKFVCRSVDGHAHYNIHFQNFYPVQLPVLISINFGTFQPSRGMSLM